MVAIVTLNNDDAWLSLVERCVRDAEVAGSNPVASIFLIPVSKFFLFNTDIKYGYFISRKEQNYNG